MPAFDLVVVGCGGGPDETNLSSYLLKSGDASWDDGIVALEAGSGLGALRKILAQHPDLVASNSPDARRTPSVAELYSRIRCFLITHPHIDHVSGLVLAAGSTKGPPKAVYGSRTTLDGIMSIFDGTTWPKLAAWAPEPHSALYLSPLAEDAGYRKLHGDLSARIVPINHGTAPSGAAYPCSAFFVRHDPSARELLFFGDVEPDALAAAPRNLEIWRAAAPRVPHALSALFIECSWPAGRADDVLYGHLSPPHLAHELAVLAAEVAASRQRTRELQVDRERERDGHRPRKKRRKDPAAAPGVRGALAGLRVYITHCKDDLTGALAGPAHQVIASQVRELVDAKGLGCEIIPAEQGMRISIGDDFKGPPDSPTSSKL